MTQFSQINSQHTHISTTTYNKTMLAIYCSIAIGVSGCSTLPEHKTLPTASVAVEPIDTSETTLAQISIGNRDTYFGISEVHHPGSGSSDGNGRNSRSS